jgi:hypothetical protein
MKLSERTDWPTEPNPWSTHVDQAKQRRGIESDLTISNPTAVGLVHDDEVYQAFGTAAAQVYEPHPFGLPSAREAVSAYYAVHGLTVDASRIWLSASTSEAYGQLLTMLCDPGEAVLVPAPGYPLLDVLGSLASVARRPYPLVAADGWAIDFDALRGAAAVPGVRALVIVAPGNPTGAYLDRKQFDRVVQLCADHELALIVDEVFADYPLEAPAGRLLHVPGVCPVPCFLLSGLSKVAALPQMKLSWVAALGPGLDIAEILPRAEQVADATLSVSGPVQLALPTLLSAAEPMRDKVVARLRYNLVGLRKAVKGRAVDMPRVEGGWTALLRLPEILDDDEWALRLLEAGVLVQPGFVYDMPSRPPWIAVSLLTERDVFDRGIERLLAVVDDVIATG